MRLLDAINPRNVALATLALKTAGRHLEEIQRSAQHAAQQARTQAPELAQSAQDRLLKEAATLLEIAGARGVQGLSAGQQALRRAPGALGRGARQNESRRQRDLNLAMGISLGVACALIAGLAYATWQEHQRLIEAREALAKAEAERQQREHTAHSETGIEDDPAYSGD